MTGAPTALHDDGVNTLSCRYSWSDPDFSVLHAVRDDRVRKFDATNRQESPRPPGEGRGLRTGPPVPQAALHLPGGVAVTGDVFIVMFFTSVHAA